MRHPDPDLRIEQYDPTTMAEPLWTSFFELNEQRFRESFPDDPLPARELKRRYMARVLPEPRRCHRDRDHSEHRLLVTREIMHQARQPLRHTSP